MTFDGLPHQVRLPTTTTGAVSGAPFDETERLARAAAMAHDKVPGTARFALRVPLMASDDR